VEESCPEAFRGVDIALFAVADKVSRALAPEAVKAGCIVIDNSSAWRMDENGAAGGAGGQPGGAARPPRPHRQSQLLHHHRHGAAQAAARLRGLRRVIASTYQAVSGAGAAGLAELRVQARQVLDGEPIAPKAFAHQIAFNLIPHIDYFEDNAYSHEEMKMFNGRAARF
jgi:aspartate-semialdehyde dehydrogenase